MLYRSATQQNRGSLCLCRRRHLVAGMLCSIVGILTIEAATHPPVPSTCIFTAPAGIPPVKVRENDEHDATSLRTPTKPLPTATEASSAVLASPKPPKLLPAATEETVSSPVLARSLVDFVESVWVRHAEGEHQVAKGLFGVCKKLWWHSIKKAEHTGDDFLTPEGRLQARHTHDLQLYLRRTDKEIQVVCSPVARALQTCFLALSESKWDFSPQKKILILHTVREQQKQTRASKCNQSTLNLQGMKDRHHEALLAVDRNAFRDGRSVDDYIDYRAMKHWFDRNPLTCAHRCKSCGSRSKNRHRGRTCAPRWDAWYSRSKWKHEEPANHFRPVVKQGLNYLLDNFKGKIVVVFTHGGTINMVKKIFCISTEHHPQNTETYKLAIYRRKVHYVENGKMGEHEILSLKKDPNSDIPFDRDGHAPLVRGFKPHTNCIPPLPDAPIQSDIGSVAVPACP